MKQKKKQYGPLLSLLKQQTCFRYSSDRFQKSSWACWVAVSIRILHVILSINQTTLCFHICILFQFLRNCKTSFWTLCFLSFTNSILWWHIVWSAGFSSCTPAWEGCKICICIYAPGYFFDKAFGSISGISGSKFISFYNLRYMHNTSVILFLIMFIFWNLDLICCTLLRTFAWGLCNKNAVDVFGRFGF